MTPKVMTANKVMTPRSPDSSPPPLRGPLLMNVTRQNHDSNALKLPDMPKPTRIPMKNWAEYESSDDETDYEEYDDNHDW